MQQSVITIVVVVVILIASQCDPLSAEIFEPQSIDAFPVMKMTDELRIELNADDSQAIADDDEASDASDAIDADVDSFRRLLTISRLKHKTSVAAAAAANATKADGAYTSTFMAEANNYNISSRVVDIFLFTQYCGPTSRLSQRLGSGINKASEFLLGSHRPPHAATNRRQPRQEDDYADDIVDNDVAADMAGGSNGQRARVTYAQLDGCCRQHDNCPNYITELGHYDLYPGLEHRNQYFARMQCSCDGLFYQCLSALQSRYASAVAIGYGIVQSYCFEYEYPIVQCARRSLWRCEAYVVDTTQPKRWQWFDVPPAYKKIFIIPQTSPVTTTTATATTKADGVTDISNL